MAYSPKNPNGQATMANSEPVVLASDQASIPVTVSGVSTAANQSTIIGHVDGIETALTAANSSLDAIEASVAAIDTDTSTIIGHLDGVEALLTTIAGDTTDIEAAIELIDDAAVVLGTATYTEATSTGLAIGAVRRDADTTLVGTSNEWGPLQMDINGRLKVEAFSGEALPVTFTGSGDVATQTTLAAILSDTTAIETAVQLIDDAIFVDDTATHATGTTKGIGIMAAAVPTDTSISANDIGMVGMTTDRRMYVESTIAATQTLSTVTTVGTVNALGVSTTGPMKAEDVGHATGDMGIPAWGVRVDSPNVALTNTDADYGAIGLNKLGSVRTAALEDDLATAATKHTYKYYTNAGAVTDGIIWSPAAGTRWFLTSLTINVSAACTVTIEDDVAAGDVVRFKFEFAANSGISIPLDVPMFSGEDAADLLITTTAGNVYVTAVGYEI